MSDLLLSLILKRNNKKNIMKFKGNFGELTLNINGTEATGTYQENGKLKGEFINNTFKGLWENKGMEGLVEFTIKDNKLEGNWKKGLEPAPMKGKWAGLLTPVEGKKSKDNGNLKQVPSEIKVITDSLKNNFLFQVSLGSKELFHSNLIAWLLEQKNINGEYEALKIFLEIIDFKIPQNTLKDENEISISREEKNIDLIIKWKESEEWKYVFIENKMKSIPTEEQLKRYNLKIKKYVKNELDSNYKFLLTPFESPTGNDTNWVNITYSSQILDFLIKSVSNISFKNPDIQGIVKKYMKLLEDQIAVLKYFGLISREENSFLERPYNFYKKESIVSVLRSIRLHDLVLKLIHHKIAKEVELRLLKMGLKLRRSNSEFTNSTGITSVDIILEESYIVGIQLQGNQFRLYTVHKEAKLNERFALELWRNKLWFYDLSTQRALIGSGKRKSYFQSHGMKDELGNYRSFCEYNQGVFLYLYKDLSKEEVTLSTSKVVNLFVQYFSHLKSKKDEFVAATKKR